ncbi:NAD-dependent epimerase/dehydratase family protein [Aliiruegeria sabulilitoris]|uniref:NAD-dependent epimerase/dehydratase family protein n=1 Tax=Aliiruegeria sabulilitoris TaxID=1510458 RepID=UPI0008294F7C|nr:NAD-dependent epimerase/dehydratase family protein [Aliiruegeria sabulilitoris]NDR58868.1 epimerase [Pseudoruegeria sp. M32A2M]
MPKTVLILGATGRFGRNAVDAFVGAGWTVRKFDRRTQDLKAEAADVDVIVNSWNPPYDQWARTVPALTRSVIEAARINDATVIIPGNVYVFGDDAPECFDETTPHAATNPLGRIRVEMEAAYRASGVQTIILRCGDFLDTTASGNWFDRVMIAKLDRNRFVYPGDPDRPHAWAFLPDATRATVMLAEMRDALGPFEDVPFPGYTLTGRELAGMVTLARGEPVAVKGLNWLPRRLLAPFWKMGRHLVEMRYLWSKPHFLDGSRFDRLLPGFRMTPAQSAVVQALGDSRLPAPPLDHRQQLAPLAR